MGVGELRPKLKRALIGIGRLVCAALMLAQVAEIVLGLDEVGIDVEGVVVARRRVVQPALRLEDQAEIAVVLGDRRIRLNGL